MRIMSSAGYTDRSRAEVGGRSSGISDAGPQFSSSVNAITCATYNYINYKNSFAFVKFLLSSWNGYLPGRARPLRIGCRSRWTHPPTCWSAPRRIHSGRSPSIAAPASAADPATIHQFTSTTPDKPYVLHYYRPPMKLRKGNVFRGVVCTPGRGAEERNPAWGRLPSLEANSQKEHWTRQEVTSYPLERTWDQTGGDIIPHPPNHKSGQYTSSGFPLFRTDKIPWLFPDFSSIFLPFSSIFLMFYFFNWKLDPF